MERYLKESHTVGHGNCAGTEAEDKLKRGNLQTKTRSGNPNLSADLTHSIGLSQAVGTAGSLVNAAVNVVLTDADDPTLPLINYKVVLSITPDVLFGETLGKWMQAAQLGLSSNYQIMILLCMTLLCQLTIAAAPIYPFYHLTQTP